MIPCVCIDAKDRPKEIPIKKWLKRGDTYHVIYTVTVLPQKMLAFHLHEIELDETCSPYEYFLSYRFAFDEDSLRELAELVKDCSETDFSIEELVEQTANIEISNPKESTYI
jgi:hypothetical protein